MSRGVFGSAVAVAALSGLLLSAGIAGADARPGVVPSCAPAFGARYAAGSRDGLCRPTVRAFQRRPVLGAVRAQLPVPSRYVSLLILGVGY